MELAGASVYQIQATVPLSTMFGYITALRNMTSGRGTFTLEFAHYAPVAADVAKEIVEGRREYVQSKR